MPRPKSGPFGRPSRMEKITQEIVRLSEIYRGVPIKASSFDDLQCKRAVIDRMIAQRICDAPNAEARAAILRELNRPTVAKTVRPMRRGIAASAVEMDEDAAEDAA